LTPVSEHLLNWPENEKQVGEGIRASGVPRSEIFLTTKLNNIDHEDASKALNISLGLLGTDYVDLCA
jgi:glycerol 2-dehydrogenase (NADP+)